MPPQGHITIPQQVSLLVVPRRPLRHVQLKLDDVLPFEARILAAQPAPLVISLEVSEEEGRDVEERRERREGEEEGRRGWREGEDGGKERIEGRRGRRGRRGGGKERKEGRRGRREGEEEGRRGTRLERRREGEEEQTHG
eukprot:761803-Hanusia_phi.AAC.2